jgi:GxxExxY protein
MDDELTRKVIGCAFEVSNTLGAGFLEKLYENALLVELENRGLSFQRQQKLHVEYKGVLVGEYIADIVVENSLLLELKAVSRLGGEHEAQLLNYLKATGLSLGLLLNFGRPKLEIKRMIWNHNGGERT